MTASHQVLVEGATDRAYLSCALDDVEGAVGARVRTCMVGLIIFVIVGGGWSFGRVSRAGCNGVGMERNDIVEDARFLGQNRSDKGVNMSLGPCHSLSEETSFPVRVHGISFV